MWDITLDFSLTPGATFRSCLRLCFQIAQVHLDRAVILSQDFSARGACACDSPQHHEVSEDPPPPASCAHRRWLPVKACANPCEWHSFPQRGDAPALAAWGRRSAGGSRKHQLEGAGGSSKVKINPNRVHQKTFSKKEYLWSCSVLQVQHLTEVVSCSSSSAPFIGKMMRISWTLETKGKQSDKTDGRLLNKDLTFTTKQVILSICLSTQSR